MKRVFLTIGMFIFSLGVLAQRNSEEDKDHDVDVYSESIIGWWIPDQDFCNIVFWVDTHNNLNVQPFSSTTGEPYITMDFKTSDITAFVRCAVFSKDGTTNVTTLNNFTLLKDKTMVCISINEETKESNRIMYSRMK